MDGHYEKRGDIEEWVWDKAEQAAKKTGGWAVPDGDFDPRSAPPPESSMSEKIATAGASPGLQVAVEPKEAKPEPTKAVTPKGR